MTLQIFKVTKFTKKRHAHPPLARFSRPFETQKTKIPSGVRKSNASTDFKNWQLRRTGFFQEWRPLEPSWDPMPWKVKATGQK